MRGFHLWLSYLFPLIFFSVVASVADAQDSIPTHTVDGAYIKEWLIIGPFPRDLEADFLAAAGGETDSRPREGMELTAPNGAVYTWKRYPSANPTINLLEAIGDYADVVAYTACNLLSPKTQQLEMWLGSDDGVKVWLNGALIHTNRVDRPLRQDEDIVPVTLAKGVNRCLIKVDQGDGRWEFAVRFINEAAYRNSLKLDISVQRRKREDTNLLDITARWARKSRLWTPPQLPVEIEILDAAGKPLATLTSQTDVPVEWVVPDEVKGTIQMRAQTRAEGLRREAQFVCQVDTTFSVTPQTFDVPPGIGIWETYDLTDGLGGPWVTSIVQDRRGAIWFGLKDGGVSRYDGRTFKTFTTQDGLPSDHVVTIFEDSRGVLWFGTMDHSTLKGAGVCRYDGETFETFTTKEGLVADSVVSIYEDSRGHLWFGTTKGVSEYDEREFRSYTTKDGLASAWVGSMVEDKDGNLWFGHGIRWYYGGRGITRYDGESFTNLTTQDGLVHDWVYAMMTDVEGNLWVATIRGVSRYNPNDGTFQNFNEIDGLPSHFVSNLLQTERGDLWFATNDGVSRYRDGVFQNFTTADGLASNLVGCLAVDREGSVWFGTVNRGVSRYDESIINIPTDTHFSRISAPVIRARQGNIWFDVPERGLGQYDGSQIRLYPIGFRESGIGALYDDNRGDLWIATVDPGLIRYDGEVFQRFTQIDGLPIDRLTTIYEDSKGVLWFGTLRSGVYTYDGETFTQAASPKEVGRSITSIIEDRNGLMWFSSGWNGVCRYDGKTFTRFTTAHGLPHNRCNQLLADLRGDIWMATGGGLCRYNGQTFETFTEVDRLFGYETRRIFSDGEGNLWFSVTAGGVHKFDEKGFRRFTTDDGLLNNTVTGIIEDENGNLIFATPNGFTIYTPSLIPPSVTVTEVIADEVYSHPTSLKIRSTTPRISFAYQTISFKTKRMRYNYILEGDDPPSPPLSKGGKGGWRATWNDTVSYESLEPGEYTFKVSAINRDLVSSEAPATVYLKITPPFYQTARFLAPTVGGGAILLGILIIQAIALVKRRREIRFYQEEAARELQDARRVQMSLMPEESPEIEGIEIAGLCQTANTVGGDFYDYLALGEDTMAIVLADVTGKGMQGAMNAALSSGALHAEAKEGMSPADLLFALNMNLYTRFTERTNCAMMIAIIDSKKKRLRYANAGIPYPYFKQGGKVFELEANGMPLGAFKSAKYEDCERQLQTGNVLVFFSDGVTEAPSKENSEHLYIEADRLFSIISAFDEKMTAQTMIDAILADVSEFSNRERSDDITLVVVKVQ